MQPWSKSRRWFWLVLFACFGVVAVFKVRHLDEPIHKGRPVRVWVDECSSFRPYGYRARDEIKKIGAPAVPYLREKLRTKDSWIRTRWWKFTQGLSEPMRLRLPESRLGWDVRFTTLSCLSSLGTNSFAAVPELVELVKQGGGDGINAAGLLSRFGPAAKDALPALRVRSPTNSFQEVAYGAAIWRISRETNIALERFLHALTNHLDPGAANLLGEMESAAAPAFSTLAAFVSDPVKPMALRINSAVALSRIGITNSSVREAYLQGMKASNTWLEVHCALGLWRMDETFGPKALGLHLEIIEESKGTPDHKNRILYLLRDYKMPPEQAIPILRSLVESGSDKQRRHAKEALQTLTNQPPFRLPTQ